MILVSLPTMNLSYLTHSISACEARVFAVRMPHADGRGTRLEYPEQHKYICTEFYALSFWNADSGC
jgi:hypothetical protein